MGAIKRLLRDTSKRESINDTIDEWWKKLQNPAGKKEKEMEKFSDIMFTADCRKVS